MKHFICFILFFIILGIAGVSSGGSSSSSMATKEAYFDIATGHKYIKNTDNTYMEYSRKGKLLRNDVPNTLPLLTRGRYIREIRGDAYLVYEKSGNPRKQQQILPASSRHPRGWQCKDMLVTVKKSAEPEEMGLAYTKDPGTVRYDGQTAFATGKAYFDLATGHKYLKNSDHTYAEYSKKGKLLKTDVPDSLPLLTSGRYIIDLDQGCYMIYEKKRAAQTVSQILPALSGHPKGWRCGKILSTIN
ncbi:hypothetical protein [Desulfospira joergensenii]|uniref:hypothetical protein n=1 Tax=Desulfospira joergensenii TaxID=53329 RepID=UPI0003B4967F|nr:hypothetical protein [Desulfospira joergensenii]